MSERHPVAAVRPQTIFFLSDYGTTDEFVGVVHAVLSAASAGVAIIDLTHQIAAFDIRAGTMALARALPYLGPGVVLAVVDPGVGSGRRGVCLEVTPSEGGPAFFVGPDNGLLIPAAELSGGGTITGVIELDPGPGPARTFDGRDLFAPAAAALSRGVPLGDLGPAVDPVSLVRPVRPAVVHATLADGRRTLRTEAVWVDRFGNVQLGATRADAEKAQMPGLGFDAAAPAGGTARAGIQLTVTGDLASPLRQQLRPVGTFADLAQGQLGLLLDANGHLAVVAGQASAAAVLAIGAGHIVTLTW